MAALIVAVSTLRLWPFLEGRLPGVGDHAVHLHKLWFLWERLLPRGRLSGFSSYWFLGEPVGELYPPGQDLWTAAVHALTLGQLSWERAYGLAFVGFYVLSAWCLYDLGRRFFGRFAGFVAALLWLLDPGAWEQGGWHYQVFYGVWGQSLAQTLLLPALWRVIRFLEEGRRADLGLAGLLLGLSLICHPMNLILIAMVGAALALAWRLRELRDLGRLGAAIGLGLLASASFLLPFLARSAYARNIGGAGVSSDEIITELSRGELLAGFPVAEQRAGGRAGPADGAAHGVGLQPALERPARPGSLQPHVAALLGPGPLHRLSHGRRGRCGGPRLGAPAPPLPRARRRRPAHPGRPRARPVGLGAAGGAGWP